MPANRRLAKDHPYLVLDRAAVLRGTHPQADFQRFVELADGAVTEFQNGRVPVRKGTWRGLRGKLAGIGR